MSDRISILDMEYTTKLAAALTARGWRVTDITDDHLTASAQGVLFEITRTADIVYLGRLFWWATPYWQTIARVESQIRDANQGWFGNQGGLMVPGLVELVSTTPSEVELAWSDHVPLAWTISLAMQAAGMAGTRVSEA